MPHRKQPLGPAAEPPTFPSQSGAPAPNRPRSVSHGAAPDFNRGAAAVEPPVPLQPWDRQPGEPHLWYGRFQAFLNLGPVRSLRQTAAHLPPRADGKRTQTCGKWGQYAAAWHWYERAYAWDQHQRDLLALSERNLRLGLRRRRLAVVEDTLDAILGLFRTANLDAVDQDTARAWLPQIRVFLRDMLAAEREEFEHDFTSEDPAAILPITADELRAAHRALEAEDALAAAHPQADPQADPQAAARFQPQADALAAIRRSSERRGQYKLLVCTGPDGDSLLDLPALHSLKSEVGLTYARLSDATPRKLNATLRRQRGLGCPIEYIHMTVHASPAGGLELAGGPLDGSWLSGRLDDVRILLLAGSRSDSIGLWLSAVPYVISLGEDIPHAEAAALAQHFWHAIGLGAEPDAALDAALARCPSVAPASVTRHW